MKIIETREIAVEELGQYALREWEAYGKAAQTVVDKSERVWAVVDEKPLIYVGVVKPSLIGVPILWFLLCKGFQAKHLRQLYKLLPTLWSYYPCVQTHVEWHWTDGCRFAEFLNFRPTFVFDGDYMIYEGRG